MGLRPLFGGAASCRYAVGCTQYAVMQLEEKSLLPAVWAIIKRLLSCNPISIFLASRFSKPE